MIKPKGTTILKKCTASLTALTLCFGMALPADAASIKPQVSKEMATSHLGDAEKEAIEKQCSEKKINTILLTDGEHDDMASMIRYLTMANEFNTKAIILTASKAGHHTGGNITYPNADAAAEASARAAEYVKGCVKEQITNEDGTVTVTYNQNRWTGFRWIHYFIEKYGEVYDNLKVHDPSYPTPDYLESIVKYGNVKAVADMQEITEGSEHIKKLILENPDGEPLYIQHWGGMNTTARALKSIEEEYKGTSEWDNIVKKINNEVTLYMIWDNQAPTYGSYVAPNWPGIRVLVNQDSFFTFYRFWNQPNRVAKEVQDTWFKKSWGDTILNIGSALTSEALLEVPFDLSNEAIQNPENKFYTTPEYDSSHGQTEADNFPFETWGDSGSRNGRNTGSFCAEGDTPSYFFLMNNGLRGYEDPTWGSWAGRFGKSTNPDRPNEYRDVTGEGNPFSGGYTALAEDAVPEGSTVQPKNYVFSRWAPDFQAEYSAHALWSVKSKYKQANHHPKAAVMNGLDLNAAAGQTINLDGVAYDPDGDELTYKWWRYADADTHKDIGTIELSDTDDVAYTIPEDAEIGDTIHLIFEVSDSKDNDLYTSLKNYKRVVITVAEPVAASAVKISKTSAAMTIGESLQLTAEITPSDVTDPSIQWSSSDAAVASVDGSGKVTANKEGTAAITATASNGVKAACKITVAAKQTGTPAQEQPKVTLKKVTIKKAVPQKKKVKLTWTKDKNASGYQIYMSKKKSSGYKKAATVKKAGKVVYTKKNLKSKKTYYFKIRSYKKVNGKYVYGKFSKVKKAKAK